MNKEELQEKSLQYALGTLPQSEEAEVEAPGFGKPRTSLGSLRMAASE